MGWKGSSMLSATLDIWMHVFAANMFCFSPLLGQMVQLRATAHAADPSVCTKETCIEKGPQRSVPCPFEALVVEKCHRCCFHMTGQRFDPFRCLFAVHIYIYTQYIYSTYICIYIYICTYSLRTTQCDWSGEKKLWCDNFRAIFLKHVFFPLLGSEETVTGQESVQTTGHESVQTSLLSANTECFPSPLESIKNNCNWRRKRPNHWPRKRPNQPPALQQTTIYTGPRRPENRTFQKCLPSPLESIKNESVQTTGHESVQTIHLRYSKPPYTQGQDDRKTTFQKCLPSPLESIKNNCNWPGKRPNHWPWKRPNQPP